MKSSNKKLLSEGLIKLVIFFGFIADKPIECLFDREGEKLLDALTFERADQTTLLQQVGLIRYKNLEQAYNSINLNVAIINIYRQIVFANRFLCDLINMPLERIIGKRPGEAIGCVNSDKSPYGCGAAKECESCQILHTILGAISKDLELSDEAVIIKKQVKFSISINLSIHVVPVKINNEKFYVISFTDIKEILQKRMFERIFFHDVLNTAGALKNLLTLMEPDVPLYLKEEFNFVEQSFNWLIDEIQSQKQLIAAENFDLVTSLTDIDTLDLIKSVVKFYIMYSSDLKLEILVDDKSVQAIIYNDNTVLRRTLGNMLKNALEATKSGEVVTVGCDMLPETSQIEFWVHNSGFITKDVQHNIFKRSFSTKGSGRGYGTYSIKLLGEKYLKGTVGFTSNEDMGTRFYIRLPYKK